MGALDAPAAESRLTRGIEQRDVGDLLRVRLVSTNVARGFIDFVHAGGRQGEPMTQPDTKNQPLAYNDPRF